MDGTFCDVSMESWHRDEKAMWVGVRVILMVFWGGQMVVKVIREAVGEVDVMM